MLFDPLRVRNYEFAMSAFKTTRHFCEIVVTTMWWYRGQIPKGLTVVSLRIKLKTELSSLSQIKMTELKLKSNIQGDMIAPHPNLLNSKNQLSFKSKNRSIFIPYCFCFFLGNKNFYQNRDGSSLPLSLINGGKWYPCLLEWNV